MLLVGMFKYLKEKYKENTIVEIIVSNHGSL